MSLLESVSWHSAVLRALGFALLSSAQAVHAQDERFSADAWLGGSAIHTGNFGVALTHATDGSIHQSGLRLQAVALRGYYRYSSHAAPDGLVKGRYSDLSVSLGYQLVGAEHGFMVSIGPSLFTKNLSYRTPDDRTGSKLGGKIAAMGYWAPARWPSAFVYGNYSSADSTGNLYANLGFSLPGELSIGPEIALLDGRGFRETRVGIHLSGLRVGEILAGVSAGTTRDQFGNRGRHLSMNVRITF